MKDEGGSRVLYLGVEDPTDQAVADDVSFRVGSPRASPSWSGRSELRRAPRAAHGDGTPEPRRTAPPLRARLRSRQRDTAPLFADETAPTASSRSASDATPAPRRARSRATCRRATSCARSTRLLIEKELFTRAELLEAVRALRDARRGRRARLTPRSAPRRDPAPRGSPMRLEYTFQLDEVAVPRFSVEAVEGIGKVFTLATLVLNVLDRRPRSSSCSTA